MLSTGHTLPLCGSCFFPLFWTKSQDYYPNLPQTVVTPVIKDKHWQSSQNKADREFSINVTTAWSGPWKAMGGKKTVSSRWRSDWVRWVWRWELGSCLWEMKGEKELLPRATYLLNSRIQQQTCYWHVYLTHIPNPNVSKATLGFCPEMLFLQWSILQ